MEEARSPVRPSPPGAGGARSARIEASSPDEFEALCAELLERVGFHRVQRVGGSGDRGIDIVAERIAEDPFGQKRTERWAVQCKHSPTSSISRRELHGETAGVPEDGADVFCLITSGWLSADAKHYVESHNRRHERFRIFYLEGASLALVLEDAMRRSVVGSGGDGGVNPLDRIQTAWEEIEDPVEVATLVQGMLPRGGDPRFAVGYLEQRHEVEYLDSGISRTILSLEAINLTDDPLVEDVVTFQGDSPSDPESLELVAKGASGPLPTTVHFDSGSNIVVGVKFGEPLEPLSLTSYEVRLNWPFPPPLRRVRHYGMPTFRLTRRHAFSIMVPNSVTPTDALLMEDVEGDLKTVEECEFDRRASHWVVSGSVERPRIGDRHKLMFDLR